MGEEQGDAVQVDVARARGGIYQGRLGQGPLLREAASLRIVQHRLRLVWIYVDYEVDFPDLALSSDGSLGDRDVVQGSKSDDAGLAADGPDLVRYGMQRGFSGELRRQPRDGHRRPAFREGHHQLAVRLVT